MQTTIKRIEPELHRPFIVAWACCVLFYFLQYALRSAPGVMVPELTSAFGLSALGASTLIGLYSASRTRSASRCSGWPCCLVE